MCLIGLVAVSAMGSVADLERMATREFVPEIQLAAGIALGRHYATVKTLAEMEALATDARATPGMRMAAQVALETLFLTAGLTDEQLIAIAETGATPELRMAVLPALSLILARRTAAVLEAMAIDGVSREIRLAAARAYYFVTKGAVVRAIDKLAAEAKESPSIELSIAAGEVLGGFFIFHPAWLKREGELRTMVREEETVGMRVAAGVALRRILIDSELTARRFMNRLLALMATETWEYRYAYLWALAIRLTL